MKKAIIDQYLQRKISRKKAVSLVGKELVILTEKTHKAVLEDVRWGLANIRKENSERYLLFINFKTYQEATGKKAIALAKKIFSAKNKKWIIAVAPSLLDLEEVCKLKGTVFAQHVDLSEYGAHTGQITPLQLKRLGAKGTILNHSERKLSWKVLKQTAEECKKVGLIIIVCASTLAEIKKVASLHPDYIAYEPAELIGGDISVTSAKPEIIGRAVALVRKISPATKVLCGAGVHSKADVQKALELGAEGVLMAHAVVKAREPKKMVQTLIS